MASILERIVASKRDEIDRAVSMRSLDQLRIALANAPPVRDFLAPLADSPPIRLIAEVKKASPSKGVLRERFDPLSIAAEYEQAGASCISVLTDEPYFQGSLNSLAEIRQLVSIPVLRKDFIVDAYQIFEARVAGADAVLLIAECLAADDLKRLYMVTRELGMHALIELYDERNLQAVLDTGTPLVGVNNRDLNSFEVDLKHTLRLRTQIPSDRVLVGESGIFSRADALLLERNGVQAMLVGESLIRQEHIAPAVRHLLGF